MRVSLNVLSHPDGFRDRVTVETPHSLDPAWNQNAFEWPYMTQNNFLTASNQNIGVGEAWRALDLLRLLPPERTAPRVKMAIIDGGFQRLVDNPDGAEIGGGGPNPVPCSGGSPCLWHGTKVVSAAMGIPNNGQGAAGPAGPVAQLVMVYHTGDLASTLADLILSELSGAEIINMSFSGSADAIPAVGVELLLAPATAAIRNAGHLLFASAGNTVEGLSRDVDATDSIGSLRWESQFRWPCEAPGVLCVGGLAWDSRMIDPGSDFGSAFGAQSDTVRIYGPFTVWVTNNPSEPSDPLPPFSGETVALRKSGTSYSSPFVAGVAALIWAGAPHPTADLVESTLLLTANRGAAGEAPAWVNAAEGVALATGARPPLDFPPEISIVSPRPGWVLQLHRAASFIANASDVEGRPNVSWTFPGGTTALGPSVTHTFDTAGRFTVVATVTDSARQSRTASVEVFVVNAAPEVQITDPADGAAVYVGHPVLLHGRATDLNEGPGPGPGVLPERALVWTSSAGDFTLSGSSPFFTFASAGRRVITLTATDADGVAASAGITVNVVPAPLDALPDLTITSPHRLDSFNGNPLGVVVPVHASSGYPAGSGVTYVWSAEWNAGSREIARNTLSFDWRPAASGVPTGLQNLPVTIRLLATDSRGRSQQRTVSITLANPPE